MSPAEPTTKHEEAKKRPSKGLRAWECKRRKVQPEGILLDREPSLDASSDSTAMEKQSHCPVHFSERRRKIEQLFERFVCRKSTNTPAVDPPRSPTLVDSTSERQAKWGFDLLPKISTESHDISTISQGIVNYHAAPADPSTPTPAWKSPESVATVVETSEGEACDRIRKSLLALLPSQHDSDVLFESTNAWTIFHSLYNPYGELYVNRDPESYALDMAAVAQERAIIIARTLMHLALSICCLPPEFDCSRLTPGWSLHAAVNDYVEAVTSLVSASDDIMCTLPGLETLLLLTLYHVNCANLRKAWLVVQRALNLAQLMGFHRIIQGRLTCPTMEAIENAKIVWRCIVDAETYLGLHLRLPFASEGYPSESGDPGITHRSKLNTLARQIAAVDANITAQTYAHALFLDEKLESLMRVLPKEFWEVPNVPSKARSPESAMVLERVALQVWHLQLKMILHLPFLLRAAKESRYEYSKISALQACRDIMLRWFALREASNTQAYCRFSELAAYMAAVTVVLDILSEMGMKERTEVQRTRGCDFGMVCRVICDLEKLAKGSPREKIAARSAAVIRKLLCTLDPSRRSGESARLTVPYFGTIQIGFQKPPIRPVFDPDSQNGRTVNDATNCSHTPVFSFVSNDLWPSTEASLCGEADFDIILFDGLDDKDTEGNWVF
ncbi:hypothetical protein M011DRAFT_484951 [Sporormia fimetaria CBS 119925]|uniref:Transcription factor domain-containing protein n=1 Tax=Sporormia fimetaria CBS 119925 TaxID=1340428 RepID=A0A6A6VIB4_9PLEO|nr:hypothetical protein M011DRAFT_484951 [Sporormia fimetaria CBS 119925]